MNRAAKVFVAALGLAGATIVPSASSSSAAESCGGSLIWHGVAKDSGRVVGALDVYWNGTTGTNCAKFSRAGGEFGDYGQGRLTYVRLSTCATKACTSYIAQKVDGPRVYAYYAGPVKVGARNHCVQADGGVYLHGAWRQVGTGTIGCR